VAAPDNVCGIGLARPPLPHDPQLVAWRQRRALCHSLSALPGRNGAPRLLCLLTAVGLQAAAFRVHCVYPVAVFFCCGRCSTRLLPSPTCAVLRGSWRHTLFVENLTGLCGWHNSTTTQHQICEPVGLAATGVRRVGLLLLPPGTCTCPPPHLKTPHCTHDAPLQHSQTHTACSLAAASATAGVWRMLASTVVVAEQQQTACMCGWSAGAAELLHCGCVCCLRMCLPKAGVATSVMVRLGSSDNGVVSPVSRGPRGGVHNSRGPPGKSPSLGHSERMGPLHSAFFKSN
jgi:hypothetical protein